MIFTGYGYQVRNPSKEEGRIIGNNIEVMEMRKAILDRLVKQPPIVLE